VFTLALEFTIYRAALEFTIYRAALEFTIPARGDTMNRELQRAGPWHSPATNIAESRTGSVAV
jgi:hypothetical protein